MEEKLNFAQLGLVGLTVFALLSFVFISVFKTIILQVLIIGACFFFALMAAGNISLDFLGVMWIISAATTLASLGKSPINTTIVSGPLIFAAGVMIVVFAKKQNAQVFRGLISLIKWGALFYSFSVLFSLIFPGLYGKVMESLFQPNYSAKALKLMQVSNYTGFTSDIAFTAGYIVNGLGILWCKYLSDSKSKLPKLAFILLFAGLLLTQKRAHLLFLGCAVILVSVVAGRFKLTPKRIFITLGVTVLIIALVIVVVGSDQKFSNRILVTIDRFFQGQDITSSRTGLYEYAWQLFKSSPLFGVGWGNYRESTVGNVTVQTKMYPHNMYLQLLAETGAIGTLLILLPFIITFFRTLVAAKALFKDKEADSENEWRPIVLFSLFYQTFFLLYAFFENTLHNYNFLLIYFLACGFYFAYQHWRNVGVLAQQRQLLVDY